MFCITAKEDPKNRILIVCTEICSIHFQGTAACILLLLRLIITHLLSLAAELCIETFVGNALFGDGSGSLIVGVQPTENERILWVIEHAASRILEHTPTLMTWEASDHGISIKHNRLLSTDNLSRLPHEAITANT